MKKISIMVPEQTILVSGYCVEYMDAFACKHKIENGKE
jgi:hypothetical protein